MVVYLIGGMPAAGKDTLADLISKYVAARIISVSRDILIPLVDDKVFQEKTERVLSIDLSFIRQGNYSSSRESLIALGDDLNHALKPTPYAHFSDLAYLLYGDSLIIPSFRQKTMLQHLQKEQIKYKTLFVECEKEVRHQRWKQRNNLTEEEMTTQDDSEFSKYVNPLLQEIKFDHHIDNSSSISDLEKQILGLIQR